MIVGRQSGQDDRNAADTFTVRQALAADAADIADCHGTLFHVPWSVDTIRAMLEAPETRAFVVAKKTGPLVGFLLAAQAADELEIRSIGVGKTEQKLGLAHRLMTSALSTARAEGVRRVLLEVATDNPAATALYARMGFQKVGQRKAYYPRADGNSCDAMILARTF